ncbi:MAG TPA: GDSL-type esterase/lipase family protein [Sphingobium sp.]
MAAALLIGSSVLFAQTGAEPKPDPSFPYSTEIEDFARADSVRPAAPNGALFLGSSSIRLWDIAGSFPGIGAINRGFGGATTPDVLHYYDRIRPRAAPRAIIVYVGENDLSAGATPAKVSRDILSLLRRLRADYPKARLAWMSLKPSPIRWTLYSKMTLVNERVGARARAEGFDYLEVGTVLLAKDGLPDASLFRPDGLHMNPRGYLLWTGLINGWLAEGAATPASVVALARP